MSSIWGIKFERLTCVSDDENTFPRGPTWWWWLRMFSHDLITDCTTFFIVFHPLFKSNVVIIRRWWLSCTTLWIEAARSFDSTHQIEIKEDTRSSSRWRWRWWLMTMISTFFLEFPGTVMWFPLLQWRRNFVERTLCTDSSNCAAFRWKLCRKRLFRRFLGWARTIFLPEIRRRNIFLIWAGSSHASTDADSTTTETKLKIKIDSRNKEQM